MFSAFVFSQRWGEEKCRKLRRSSDLDSSVANMDASIKVTAASKDATIAKFSALTFGLIHIVNFQSAVSLNGKRLVFLLTIPGGIYTAYMTFNHTSSWYRNYSLVEHYEHLENFRTLTE